jgi:hypothetical protein
MQTDSLRYEDQNAQTIESGITRRLKNLATRHRRFRMPLNRSELKEVTNEIPAPTHAARADFVSSSTCHRPLILPLLSIALPV